MYRKLPSVEFSSHARAVVNTASLRAAASVFIYSGKLPSVEFSSHARAVVNTASLRTAASVLGSLSLTETYFNNKL
jgi:hypothetical protein